MKMANLMFSAAVMLLLATLWGGAAAQSNDCTNMVVSMSPCLNYGNSSAAPSAACCTQLSTVARSHPQCLCQVIDGGGLSVDQAQAEALPKACNVQIPDSTNCKAASPSGSPGSTPNSGGGSNSGTSLAGNGSSIRLTIFTAACVLIFSMGS